MFRNDLLRVLRSPNWIVAVLIAVLVASFDVLLNIISTLLQNVPWQFMGMNSLVAYRYMWLFSILVFILPLVCVLPYGVSISDEVVSGQLRLLVYRSGRKKYLWTRLASVSLSGGLASALVVLLIGLISLSFSHLNKMNCPRSKCWLICSMLRYCIVTRPRIMTQ